MVINITVERCSLMLRLAAAASGPGVGGTSTCVVYSPEDNANDSCAGLTDACVAIEGINLDRIIKPESQNTGMPTSNPMHVIASMEFRGPKKETTF